MKNKIDMNENWSDMDKLTALVSVIRTKGILGFKMNGIKKLLESYPNQEVVIDACCNN